MILASLIKFKFSGIQERIFIFICTSVDTDLERDCHYMPKSSNLHTDSLSLKAWATFDWWAPGVRIHCLLSMQVILWFMEVHFPGKAIVSWNNISQIKFSLRKKSQRGFFLETYSQLLIDRKKTLSLRIGILSIKGLNGVIYLYSTKCSKSHMYDLKSNALLIREKCIQYD